MLAIGLVPLGAVSSSFAGRLPAAVTQASYSANTPKLARDECGRFACLFPLFVPGPPANAHLAHIVRVRFVSPHDRHGARRDERIVRGGHVNSARLPTTSRVARLTHSRLRARVHLSLAADATCLLSLDLRSLLK